MSNTVYNVQRYVSFSADEFISMLTTSAFVAIILSMRDLFFVRFGDAESVRAALLVFVLVLLMLIVTVWICKIVAVRLGYTVRYREHLVGLIVGAIISFASAGYLPIFIPGGFNFVEPERLHMGKFHGLHRGWEVGLIAGTFPLAMLLGVFIFNPLYLATQGEFFLTVILAACLFAVYACIPIPMLDHSHKGGRPGDLFKYLHGSTFGLDVFFASGAWYIVLTSAVVFFALISWLLIVLSIEVGIGIAMGVYIVSLVLGVLSLFVYNRFFK